MWQKVKEFFNNAVGYVLGHIIALMFTAISAGLLMLWLDYGSKQIFLLGFGLGFIYKYVTKLVNWTLDR